MNLSDVIITGQKLQKKIVINSVFLQDCVSLVTPKNKKGKSWHLEKYNKIFAMMKIIQRLTMHPFDGWMVFFFFRVEVLLFTFLE